MSNAGLRIEIERVRPPDVCEVVARNPESSPHGRPMSHYPGNWSCRRLWQPVAAMAQQSVREHVTRLECIWQQKATQELEVQRQAKKPEQTLGVQGPCRKPRTEESWL